MKFPRVHLFVDAKCPALVSGKITGWAAPSKLVAMLGIRDVQFAPDGSSAAGALRSWREGYELSSPEIQIIIEGELMSGLLLGLGDHIRDVYCFADKDAMDRAETFSRLCEHHRAFQQSVSRAEDCFDALHVALSQVDPDLEDPDTCASVEIVAELGLGDAPSMPGVLVELAGRYAAELAPAKSQERRAA